MNKLTVELPDGKKIDEININGVIYDLVERKSTVKELEWKILSMRNIKYKDRIWQVEKNKLSSGMVGQSKYSLEEWLASPDCEIYSVQYKDEVFTIGDRITSSGWDKITEDVIEKIGFWPLDKTQLQFGTSKDYYTLASTAIKVKEKPVLFTTEDGVDMREGDSYFVVNAQDPKSVNACIKADVHCDYKSVREKGVRWLSSYKKAEEYIDLHEKKYSKAELLEALEATEFAWEPTFSFGALRKRLGL